MKIATIYQNGEIINRIVADEDFASAYCAENGYTYTMEEAPDPDPAPEPEPEPYTADDLLSALLGLETPGNAGGGRLREALEPQAIRGVALFLDDGSVAYLRTGVGA